MSLMCWVSTLMRGRWPIIWTHFLSGVVIRMGTLKTNTTEISVAVWSGWTTAGLPFPKETCGFLVHSTQVPHGSVRPLPQMSLAFHTLSRSKQLILRWSARELTLIVCVLCPLPRSTRLRWLGGEQGTVPDGPCILTHLSVPRHCLCWLGQKGTVAGVPCVSRVEPVSGCEPAGFYELSMNPGKHGEQLAACLELGGRYCLCNRDTSIPLTSASSCHAHCSLPPWWKGHKRWLTWSPFVFSSVQDFVLWVWQPSLCGLRAFSEESALLPFLSSFHMV